MFVTHRSKNSLFYVFDSLSNLDCGQWNKFWIWQRRHKVLTHGQERLFCKVTSVSIHSFVEWLDTFSYLLRPTDVTVKEVNHIRRFAIDIAKDLVLLSCRLAMEHLCMLQLETALATLVTTWFTLADRRWRSRYRSYDQYILNAFRSLERYNGWFREQLGHRFTFLNFFPMMTDNAWNFLYRGMVSENKGNRFVDLFFFVLQEVISVNFTDLWKPALYNFVIISPSLQMMA
jgi:hypothetical protein